MGDRNRILSELYWTQAIVWAVAALVAHLAGEVRMSGAFGALAGYRAILSFRARLQ